jgi:hypothetical protein
VAWSGIKRVGNAFIMGQFAATNIMRQIDAMSVTQNFLPHAEQAADLIDCPPMKPMMALSIGDTALVYPKGEAGCWSEESRELVVGRGLGIDRKLSTR